MFSGNENEMYIFPPSLLQEDSAAGSGLAFLWQCSNTRGTALESERLYLFQPTGTYEDFQGAGQDQA